ncbi:TRAP transporter substrate-binding protein DctP [Microbacterium sp. No. 7]|uniref:TRAP transporter substrate-binding protein DctP n=1 Tax=Microbacterium sp. No. 7 TaxID=1714373 RepID=UPI0012E1C0DA|nr:TRAP transporter substrate-binding protein DctP [Microbacterium sp. No. 7]
MGLALIASGCTAAGEKDGTVTLVMADGFSAKHPVGKGGSQVFLEYIREHGPAVGLELDYYGAGQLGSQADMLNLVRTRAVDIGYLVPSYLANEVPLTGIGDLPGLAEDTCEASDIIAGTMRPGGFVYENELHARNIQVLWGGLIADLEVITSTQQITTPDDLHGLLIRSAGGISDRVIYGLGAAPVQLPSGDIYEAVARGTVAGLTTSPYVINAYGLVDEIGYSTAGANLGATSFYLTINHEAWEELDEAQQAVLVEASALAHDGTCETLAEANAGATGTLEDAGVVFTPVDDSNRAQWSGALENIRESWVSDLESVGIPAGDALADVEQRLTGGDR